MDKTVGSAVLWQFRLTKYSLARYFYMAIPTTADGFMFILLEIFASMWDSGW